MALTAGLAKNCTVPNSGGVSRIALANVDDIASITEASGVISGITMATGKTFYEFQMEQDTAEWRESGELVNGSLKYTEEVEFYIRRLASAQRAAIKEIGENLCGMVALIADSNGQNWVVGWTTVLGFERPLKLATDNSTTGKELTDLAGSTITLTCMSPEKALSTSVSFADVLS